jgi:Ca-activated chloride channel homolog
MIENFHFLRPLWFLALLPLALVAWYSANHIKTGKAWSQVCDPHLLPYIMNSVHGNIEKRIPWSAILSAILVISALAGPVWQRIPQPVFSNQSALVIALDLSRSMEATDNKPNRITRARHKVLDILSRRVEGQTALIVYAAEPFVVSPLTDDTNNIASLVKSLTTDMMPAQGSQPMLAIQKALELFKHSGIRRGDILLVTDGWPDNHPFAVKQAGGHRLSILGVGSPEGAPIPLPEGGFFSDYDGAIVIPKLNVRPLQEIAAQTGGYYASLQTDDSDLDFLLESIKKNRLSMKVAETEFLADSWHEEGPWLLLPVLLWAAASFRRQGLLVFLLFFSLTMEAQALEWDELWLKDNQRGVAALAEDRPADAAKLFTDPQWRAAAQYRAGDYAATINSLKGQDSADSLYNSGNALTRLGKLPEAMDAYDRALKKDPDHSDAKHNLELVKKAMEKQQKPPSKKSGKSDKKKKDKSEQSKEGSEDDKGQKPDSDSEKNPDSDKKNNSSANNDKDEKKSAQEKQKEAEKKSAQEKQKEAEKKKQEQTAKKQQAEKSKKPPEKASQKSLDEQLKEDEAKMAVDQWLRRIPDDPGGLLRRKFLHQYNNSRRPTSETEKPW